VLVDAEAVNLIDVSACDALLNLLQELRSQGISFAVARVRDRVRERLRLGGVEALVGSTNFYERVTDGVRAWQQHEAPDGASSGTS
jgi:anti-anti-sigma regulatory factor